MLSRYGETGTAGGNVNWYNHSGNQVSSVLKHKHIPAIEASRLTPRHLPKRKRNMCPYENL